MAKAPPQLVPGACLSQIRNTKPVVITGPSSCRHPAPGVCGPIHLNQSGLTYVAGWLLILDVQPNPSSASCSSITQTSSPIHSYEPCNAACENGAVSYTHLTLPTNSEV